MMARDPRRGMGPRWRLVLVALLALGGALRTIQYLGQVSLWHDELAIARNIQDRDARDLITAPLDHRQVAPVGFLVAVKAATRVFGVNELGLRLVPWLAGMLSLPLFAAVGARFVSGAPLLAGVAIFAASPALVWYGASVKQYGTDLAASLLLVWLALRIREHPDRLRRAAAASAAGGAAILFSHPAVMTGVVLLCVLVLLALVERWSAPRLSLVAVGAGWGASALVAAGAAMRLLDPATNRFMQAFWRDGFPPPLSEPLALLTWLPRQLFAAFAHFLLFVTPPALVLLLVAPLAAVAAIGLVQLVRFHPGRAALLSAPIIAGVAAAAAGLLPLRHRVALHAVWPILVLAITGVAALENRLRQRRPRFASAIAPLAAAPLVLIVLLAARPPHSSGQETRPIIEELARRWNAGDGLYVYCGARHAIAFYGPRHRLDAWVANDCSHDDARAYLREVDALRGRSRVWFFSMLFPGTDATIVRSYLRTIGSEEEAISGVSVIGQKGRGVDLYRYDLSDPARLAATSAAAFQWPAAATPQR
jgi:hypothetical protein